MFAAVRARLVLPLLILLGAGCGSSTAASSTASRAPAPAAASTPATVPTGLARWEPLTGSFNAERFRAQDGIPCVISREGRVACWGEAGRDDDSTPLAHRVGFSAPMQLAGVDGAIDVAAIWFYVCVAQREDAGTGGCIPTIDLGRPTPQFPRPPVELEHGPPAICARMRDGTVGCMSHDGAYADVEGVQRATSLTCTDRSCCALTPDGARCWGAEVPVLGVAESTKAIAPKVKLPPLTSLAFGRDGACGRTQAGGAHCWGTAKALSQPTGVRAVTTIDHALCVILDAGTLRCTDERVPAGTNIVAGAGRCVLHADGSVSCFSFNDNGELGNGDLLLAPLPLQVPDLDNVVDLHVAHTSACAVRRDKKVWCWGPTGPSERFSLDGALIPAQYMAACRNTKTAVRCTYPALNGEWYSFVRKPPASVKTIVSAAMHRDSSLCVADQDGNVLCQHGMSEGGVDDRWVPLASPAPVEELAPLGVGFCARHRDGRVSCFVDRRYDNDDDFLDTLPAGKLELVAGIQDATQLVTGQDLACVITKASEVWCWSAERPKPVEMTSLRGATALGANHLHTCAIVKGEIWCWGDNFLGQLGDGLGGGRIEPAKQPVKAKTTFNAVKVGTGRDSTCALDDQGKVWCWGANAYGTLGHGRTLRADEWSRVVGLGPPAAK